MLTRVLLSIVIAAVTGLAFLSIREYNQHEDEQVLIARTEEFEESSELAAKDNQISALSGEIDRLRTECDKGHYAYEQLTESGRSDVIAPECIPLTDQERAAQQEQAAVETAPLTQDAEPSPESTEE